MKLKLMYITNNPVVAEAVQRAGVDRVFIDLETLGKEERQGNIDSVKSHHTIEDIKTVRKVVDAKKLLVRVNPINPNSQNEINDVICAGADSVMLPMYKTANEIKQFVKFVGGRAKTCLLLETKEAEEIIDDTLKIDGIDEIHIGLNDLHLSHKMTFMFEPLANGIVEKLCAKMSSAKIPYGFGGISNLGQGLLPSENIVAEHCRLGSSMVILSRSFCPDIKTLTPNEIYLFFKKEIDKLRDFEKELENRDKEYYKKNQDFVNTKVCEIVKILKEKNENK